MIGASLEKRIAALKRENESRKASYPVAGSKVKFVAQTSQSASRTQGGNTSIFAKITFTPDNPGKNGKSLIELIPEVSISSDFSTRYPRITYRNIPQTGDGKVAVELAIHTVFTPMTYYFRCVAQGTSRGTFSIQFT